MIVLWFFKISVTKSSVIILKNWPKLTYWKNHIPHDAFDSNGKDVGLDQDLCQDERENFDKDGGSVKNHDRKFVVLQNSSKTHTD